MIDGETNYAIMRERLITGELHEPYQWVEDPPSNADILKMLDALHADIQGTTSRDVEKVLQDRWFSS